MDGGDRGSWSGAGGRWRVILHGARPGAWNMAVDEAVLEARARDEAPATLRLYWWERPTVSLGRFQAAADVDLEACARAGVDVVRRPTGGRAVLHDAELTYSVVASVADGMPAAVAAGYRALCGALVAAYRRLGVAAALTPRPRGRRSSACYLQATCADVSLGDAKLCGSAQVRRGKVCLQHGSLVVARDLALEARLLRLDEEAAGRLGRGTATIRDALGRDVSREEVGRALRGGMAQELGVVLREGALSPAEEERAAVLSRAATVVSQPPPDAGADGAGRPATAPDDRVVPLGYNVKRPSGGHVREGR
ncbi:MAG: lipoate--protein ligase family protein [Coriobacteriia bacterium]|nr:lipoate--protein ligase family protein [Coriobacteriia bacterium]